MAHAVLKVSREFTDTMDRDKLVLADISEPRVMRVDATPDEIASLKEGVTQISMEEEALAEERKATMAHLRERAKQLRERKALHLRGIRQGKIERAISVHIFREEERARVHIYNDEGVRIEMRQMTAEERQLTIPEA